MTPIEINAEIYRAMSVIAEDEALLRRVLKYVAGGTKTRLCSDD